MIPVRGVRRSARRKGIGSHLLRYAIAHASVHDFSSVRLRTDNPKAVQIYEALGFQRCHAAESATHERAL